MTDRLVRIGGASGFWGDTNEAAPQLIAGADIDYLVFDYLAEVTLSLLARMKARDPAMGYAPDFVTGTMALILPDVMQRNIRIVSNAGGVNPEACASAIAKSAAEVGLAPKIAVITGDDLTENAADFAAKSVEEMFTGAAFPAEIASINAYLGAFPIARALARGADIVITGRCVDSALALGALIHEFGWRETDYDLLSAGSLCGHIIECGTQATGGNFTDWQQVPGWDDMGFPVAECQSDGSFTLTKPTGTGGLISRGTVCEQMLYEIGDPARYLLPDVTCDWTRVDIRESAPNRVRLTGALGSAPTDDYKVSATYRDGFRSITSLMIGGQDAAAKARRTGEAILKRTRRLFMECNLGDYDETSIETLGAESTYGPHGRASQSREVVLKIGVKHAEKAALEIFAREIAPSALSMAPGITGFYAGRPSIQPVIRLFSFLTSKAGVSAKVRIDGKEELVAYHLSESGADPLPSIQLPDLPPNAPDLVEVPLVQLAWARSGDKGNSANIGVIARTPDCLPWINEALTEDAVASWFKHLADGPVQRFYLPGILGFNFLIHRALGGGGMASLRIDPQGKAFAQMLLDMPVSISQAALTEIEMACSPPHPTPYGQHDG